MAKNGGFDHFYDYSGSVVYQVTGVAQCGVCWLGKLAKQPGCLTAPLGRTYAR